MSENDVRATAVREAASYIERITQAGMISRAVILLDLEAVAERMEKGMTARGSTRVVAEEPERRAPVQASRGPYPGPAGTISWREHLDVWQVYAQRHGSQQDAERIAARGGFGYSEIVLFTGHRPRTFVPVKQGGAASGLPAETDAGEGESGGDGRRADRENSDTAAERHERPEHDETQADEQESRDVPGRDAGRHDTTVAVKQERLRP